MTNQQTLQPVRVVRGVDGYWLHPDVPYNIWPKVRANHAYVGIKAWADEHGVNLQSVAFYDNAPDALIERMFKGDMTALHEWQPPHPNNNAFLVAIYDTTDGPIAVFATPHHAMECGYA